MRRMSPMRAATQHHCARTRVETMAVVCCAGRNLKSRLRFLSALATERRCDRSVDHREEGFRGGTLMRVTTMAIALAATLALPTLATAYAGFPRKDYPPTDNAANAPGANTAQGQVTNRGPRTTTGQA